MAHVSPQEFENAGNMDELLGLLGRAGIENGWAKREPSMYAKPKKPFIPAQWEWAQARAALDAAGRTACLDGGCREGYTGVLCQQCAPGWARSGV